MKATLLALVVLTAAGMAFHSAGTAGVAKAGSPHPAAHPSPSATSLALPLFFEPNQGQTDGRVKFMARGAGYGLFLTANEAVLSLQHRAIKGQPSTGSVIRMRLDGANSSARIQGAQPLPGKSNYFIGNDPAKWRRGIPQFARVEYQGVYPGIDLVYYGNPQQLEYDFRVAPGAEPNQIALSFQGASARLESGDLVLSTAEGDVRFHAPHIYQPAGQAGANAEMAIPGSFRLLADNKIGFDIGAYDHSRELVIDPVLSFSTYLGGEGTEPLVKVAVDASDLIYVAGSTTSTMFPVTSGALQSSLTGNPNIFIATINSFPQPAQLVYATYLGGTGADSLAGVAVDPKNGSPNIYVAGSTTSADFPTTSNAFQTLMSASVIFPGTHGFLTKLSPMTGGYQLAYSTFLAGTTTGGAAGTDTMTGLAVDQVQNAYLTGVTNSTNDETNGFPANTNGLQRASNSPGNNQFFASVINTAGSGPQSMIYSTYFGGGNPPGAMVIGGGIAVDPVGSNSSVNLYFTGATNMQNAVGPNGEAKFPIFNAYQNCLNNNIDPVSHNCNPSSAKDAILVKLNPSPTQPQAPPLFSTYLGGSQDDAGIAVTVDSLSNAYVTGSTNSPTTGVTDWNCIPSACVVGPYGYLGGGNSNAFVAKVGPGSAVYPLTFFTYIGGTGPDSGQAIAVDSVGAAHVAGFTSGNLPVVDPLPQGSLYGGNGDAFVALVSTNSTSTGNYISYLGGSQSDEGTGIALDLNNSAYVVGTTQSPNFPPVNPLPGQGMLNGVQNAFVARIDAVSTIKVSAGTGSPNPNPVPAGQQVTFTFDLTNTGTDPATSGAFRAFVPQTGIASPPTATVTSGGGSCGVVVNGLIDCTIGALGVNSIATVAVNVTPSIPVNPLNPYVSVSGAASANGSALGQPLGQQDPITDFTIIAGNSGQVINAGDLASFPITLTPGSLGYNGTITMSETSREPLVTNPAPTFTVTPVVLSGTGQATTVLNIQTVARPVATGSLFRRTSFYATWLPIGGLSLAGLGIGATRKRRRWLAGAVLGLLAGLILLQPACSSGSSAVGSQGGTAPGPYHITIVGSSGTTASHNAVVTLNVN